MLEGDDIHIYYFFLARKIQTVETEVIDRNKVV
jgi:hypothetical protein